MASYKATVKGNVKLSTTQMRRALTTHQKEFEAKVDSSVNSSAQFLQEYMKANAPWRDRTTRARTGLFAIGSHVGRTWQIIMGHSVSYGIYLEKYMSEQYAIVEPTRVTQGQEVIARMRGLWG